MTAMAPIHCCRFLLLWMPLLLPCAWRHPAGLLGVPPPQPQGMGGGGQQGWSTTDNRVASAGTVPGSDNRGSLVLAMLLVLPPWAGATRSSTISWAVPAIPSAWELSCPTPGPVCVPPWPARSSPCPATSVWRCCPDTLHHQNLALLAHCLWQVLVVRHMATVPPTTQFTPMPVLIQNLWYVSTYTLNLSSNIYFSCDSWKTAVIYFCITTSIFFLRENILTSLKHDSFYFIKCFKSLVGYFFKSQIRSCQMTFRCQAPAIWFHCSSSGTHLFSTGTTHRTQLWKLAESLSLKAMKGVCEFQQRWIRPLYS